MKKEQRLIHKNQMKTKHEIEIKVFVDGKELLSSNNKKGSRRYNNVIDNDEKNNIYKTLSKMYDFLNEEACRILEGCKVEKHADG